VVVVRSAQQTMTLVGVSAGEGPAFSHSYTLYQGVPSLQLRFLIGSFQMVIKPHGILKPVLIIHSAGLVVRMAESRHF